MMNVYGWIVHCCGLWRSVIIYKWSIEIARAGSDIKWGGDVTNIKGNIWAVFHKILGIGRI